ncbi:MAG: hypothetical protein Q9210_002664, partial [Variospora velana]
MASSSRKFVIRTSQLVETATLYYRQKFTTDWTRLDEAYHVSYQGINVHVRQLSEMSNVENVLFNGSIQIEQAAEKYNQYYKSAGPAFMTKPENRWRIQFQRDQYTNVLIKEGLMSYGDPLEPPVASIEVIFDVVSAPAGSDVSVPLPKVAASPAVPDNHSTCVSDTKDAVEVFIDAHVDLRESKHRAEKTLGERSKPVCAMSNTSPKALPLAALFELDVTKIRIVFARPKATKPRLQWSWPAGVRFLQSYQSYQSCDKPETVSKAIWDNLVAGSLQSFVTSGVDNAGLMNDASYISLLL